MMVNKLIKRQLNLDEKFNGEMEFHLP